MKDIGQRSLSGLFSARFRPNVCIFDVCQTSGLYFSKNHNPENAATTPPGRLQTLSYCLKICFPAFQKEGFQKGHNFFHMSYPQCGQL
jgi:hypothetical protein